jgi:hypothetical protein
MTILERNIHEDLSSADDIRWFRGYLQGLLASGELTPDQLEQVLKRVYEKFRDEGREELADLTLDGLDFLTGWSGPGMGIGERESA